MVIQHLMPHFTQKIYWDGFGLEWANNNYYCNYNNNPEPYYNSSKLHNQYNLGTAKQKVQICCTLF